MKVVGSTIFKVARARRLGKMARCTKEHLTRGKSREKVTIDGLMAVNTTVSGIRINLRDGGDIYGQTASSSMDPSPTTK